MSKDIDKVLTTEYRTDTETDLWSLRFKRELEIKPSGYGDLTIKFDKAVLRMFFNWEDVEDKEEKFLEKAGYRYRYEQLFYTDVVNPLVFSGACPYFVTCYATSKGCSFDQMIELAYGKVTPRISRDVLRQNFIRNMNFILDDDDTRLSLTDDREVSGENASRVQDYRIGCTLLQNDLAFKFINDWLGERGGRTDRSTVSDIWKLLFQLSTAYYALFLSRSVQNASNTNFEAIRVEHTGALLTVYEIDGKMYRFASEWKIYLREFDIAYSQRLGDNETIGRKTCKRSGYCNELANNRDFILVCANFQLKRPELPLFIPELVCKPGHIDKFDEVLRFVKYIDYDDDLEIMPNSWFNSYFKPLSEIIPELYMMFSSRTSLRMNPANIHCLDKKYFGTKGEVNTKMVLDRIQAIYSDSWKEGLLLDFPAAAA